MQLNLKTDFALRMLMTLAARESVTSIDWIAERYGLSRNHLAKVAQDLAAHGFIETIRGRGGGIRLAHRPDQINVGEVVRKLETTDSFVACLGPTPDCAIDGICGLKPALSGALNAFLCHLDRFTLADITAHPAQLRQRLDAVGNETP